MTDAKQDHSRTRPRLGRGLSSLLRQPVPVQVVPTPAPTIAPESRRPAESMVEETPAKTGRSGENTDGPINTYQIAHIALSAIRSNPNQPRKNISDERLASLAASIRSQGMMQPIVVRPLLTNTYELIAGERRWRAARLAGLNVIPALIRLADDQSAAELALIENLQREDLNPIERADAFQALIERFGLTQTQVAERVGMDRSTVTNLLRLNTLDASTRLEIQVGRLSLGHAKVLLTLIDADIRRRLAEAAVAGQWSVRDLERRVERLGRNAGIEIPGTARKAAHILDLERRLGAQLGLPVRLVLGRRRNSGRLIVEFRNLAEFDRITEWASALDAATASDPSSTQSHKK